MAFTVRQNEILDVSLRIISEEGVQNFTMRQIAGVIGISEPAIYRHFPNKIAILEALLERFGQVHRDLASHHLKGKRLSEIKDFLSAILDNLAQHPALSAIIFSEEIFQNEPSLRAKVSDMMEKTQNDINSQLEALKINAFLPTEHITWMLLGSVRFLVAKWRLSNFDFDLSHEGKSFASNLLKIVPCKTEEGDEK